MPLSVSSPFPESIYEIKERKANQTTMTTTIAIAMVAALLPEHLVQVNPRLATYPSLHIEQSVGNCNSQDRTNCSVSLDDVVRLLCW